MNYISLSELKDELINFFRAKSILPVLGSGFTVGECAENGLVPSGSLMKEHMLRAIMDSEKINDDDFALLKIAPFSEVCSIYESDEFVSAEKRRLYYQDNFTNVTLSDAKKEFLNVGWEYIYTLNIDDAIENNSSFSSVIVSNRIVYENAFRKGTIIKLHGDVKDVILYQDSDCKVFSQKEYALSINKNASLLAKLENDFRNQNIIFIGCSLIDEFDLLSISSVPLNQKNDSRVKKIFCTDKKPSVLYEAKLKGFNITDIVVVDDYEDLYRHIYWAWRESQKKQEDELQDFCGIPTKRLSATEENSDYFYFGKRLFNRQKNIITYPCPAQVELGHFGLS